MYSPTPTLHSVLPISLVISTGTVKQKNHPMIKNIRKSRQRVVAMMMYPPPRILRQVQVQRSVRSKQPKTVDRQLAYTIRVIARCRRQRRRGERHAEIGRAHV